MSENQKEKELKKIDELAEYHRFDEKDLPCGLLLWPDKLKEPLFSAEENSAPGISNGLYYKCWPGGQIKLVANVYKEKITEWLRLENGTAEGCWTAGYYAQKYYSNGYMEDFHPWADSEPDYPATVSFENWVRPFFEGMDNLIKKR